MKTFAIFEKNVSKLEKKLDLLISECPHATFNLYQIGKCKKQFRHTFKIGKTSATYVAMQLETIIENDNWQVIAPCIVNGEMMDVKHQFVNCPLPCQEIPNETGENSLFVVNFDTGEFLQVAESQIGQYFDELTFDEVMKINDFYDFIDKLSLCAPVGLSRVSSYNTKEVLRYFVALLHSENFVKHDDFLNGFFSTATKTLYYYDILHSYALDPHLTDEQVELLKREMEENGFDPENPEAYRIVDNALEWLFTESYDDDFYHKLKPIASLLETDKNHFNILIYAIIQYKKSHIDDCQYIVKESEWKGQVDEIIYIKECSLIPLVKKKNYYSYYMIDNNDNLFLAQGSRPIKRSKGYRALVVGHDFSKRGNKQTKIVNVKAL